MKEIPAAQINLAHDSLVWPALESRPPCVFGDHEDMIILDAKWLRDVTAETLKEDKRERTPEFNLRSALDGDKQCVGWKKYDLLYFFPE